MTNKKIYYKTFEKRLIYKATNSHIVVNMTNSNAQILNFFKISLNYYCICILAIPRPT